MQLHHTLSTDLLLSSAKHVLRASVAEEDHYCTASSVCAEDMYTGGDEW